MSRLVRNAEKVHSFLKELPDGQLLTSQPCRIQVPARFNDRGLAQVGIDNYVFGIFALIYDDGSYAVCNIDAMVKILPYKVLTVNIKDVPYHEFHFEANSVVIANLNLVKRDTLIYNLLEEFFFNGNIPWYLEYEDVGKIFDTSSVHAGINVNNNFEVLELLASMIARTPTDRTKYYRTFVEDVNDMVKTPPVFVPMKSVFYSATNTLNKLAGAYFNDGVVSALVQPTHEVERIEQLLRT